jgi:hypothetical protein
MKPIDRNNVRIVMLNATQLLEVQEMLLRFFKSDKKYELQLKRYEKILCKSHIVHRIQKAIEILSSVESDYNKFLQMYERRVRR